VPGFIVQGGGFIYTGTPGSVDNIVTFPAVVNEPEFSNVAGTIAMAKLGNDPNSATSQWFFNLVDNSGSPPNGLDSQNEGFTVFGEVIGDGMTVLNDIAALQSFNFGGALTDLPLQNYSTTDFTNNVLIDDTHLIMITEIVVTDTTVDSAAGLNPTRNTSNNSTPPPTSGGGGGGGGLGFLTLIGLLIGYRLHRSWPGKRLAPFSSGRYYIPS